MSKRETIVAEIVRLLKAQKSVKLRKVDRDPIIPEELAKTAFPACYVETTDEEIEDISMGGLRQGVLECALVIYVMGGSRDKQRNVVTSAVEQTLMEDRTLGSRCKDIALTRIETLAVGEASPYASFRLIFTIEYCYNLTEE